jgi:GMP synthase (glutamine-hydrolysing)
MILLIDICKNELHRREFVNPIIDILIANEVPFDVLKYDKITSRNKKKILSKYHRIILCGTSLFDMDYSKNIKKFNWLKEDIVKDKPILGICGGMQILCMVNGCKLEKNMEIGLVTANFSQEFLKIKGEREVYAIHNYGISNDQLLNNNFKIFAKSKISKFDGSKTECIQAVMHKKHKHFGVLFHPEVRNKDLIVNFLSV